MRLIKLEQLRESCFLNAEIERTEEGYVNWVAFASILLNNRQSRDEYDALALQIARLQMLLLSLIGRSIY